MRPEDISLADASVDDSDVNVLPGTVTAASFLGNVVHYEVTPRSSRRVFRVEGSPGTPFDSGAAVTMRFRPENTIVLPRS